MKELGSTNVIHIHGEIMKSRSTEAEIYMMYKTVL